ncbi:MAG: NUDIX domain-containing protein [Muribaculaceae bacterium]|nr:NUDIX domain-containing protein [Muribaculaceae bacterium]
MRDNGEEMFPVVDEEGNILNAATRAKCHDGSKLLHPVVHLHLFDKEGRLYLQKRPEWKDIQPGKWDTAVGGHVDLGENIHQALRREAKEELGLEDFDAELLAQYVFESEIERELVNSFKAVTDIKPVPSSEVAEGKFWSKEEIESAMGKGVFTPNFESEYKKLFGENL